MAVDFADFVAFFDEKKRDQLYVCPFCGHTSFSVNSISGTLNTPSLLTINSTTTPPGNAHLFYAVSCDNCGRTDFFHSNQVDTWKARKGEGS